MMLKFASFFAPGVTPGGFAAPGPATSSATAVATTTPASGAKIRFFICVDPLVWAMTQADVRYERGSVSTPLLGNLTAPIVGQIVLRCKRRSVQEARAPLVALEGELDQPLEQVPVRDARGLEQLCVDARRGEAGNRVQLVHQHLAVLADEAVGASHPLALGRDERLHG